MIDERMLFDRFHAAYDVEPPPGAFDRLRAAMIAAPARPRPGRWFRPAATAWLVPAIAVLITVAIIGSLLIGLRDLHLPTPVPVRPPQHGQAGPAACAGWSSSPLNNPTQPQDRMFTSATGWAGGALRTTDGGAHWRDVAPDAMFSDAPSGTDPAAYPPAYTDFFFDSDHAWLAYALPSKDACFDHVTLFSTADGGRTWARSRPIDAPVQADARLQLQLFFLDRRHGWLMVLGNGRLAPDWFLYSTADGGRDWQLVAQMPALSSWCSFEFVSLTTGFLGGCPNGAGPAPTLVETRDGGVTWTEVTLPIVTGNMFQPLAPVFFDAQHGVIEVLATLTQGNTSSPADYLVETVDGGVTWHGLPAFSFPGYAQAVGFIDREHFVAVTADDKSGVASIYVSGDTGRTWTASDASLPAAFQTTLVIQFVDSRHGFVDEPSPTFGGAPTVFLVTGDGGLTWTDAHPARS